MHKYLCCWPPWSWQTPLGTRATSHLQGSLPTRENRFEDFLGNFLVAIALFMCNWYYQYQIWNIEMWKATSLCLWRSLFWLLATRSLMFFGTIPSFRSSSPPPCIRSWWWPWGAGILDNVSTFFFLSSISINITLFVVFFPSIWNVHTYIYGHDKSIVTMTSSLWFLLQARLLPWVMIYWDWRSETSVNRRKVFIATNRFLSTTALLSGTTRSQQWLLAIMVIIIDIDSHSGT